MNNKSKKLLCSSLVLICPVMAEAAEVTLKAVSAFGQDTYFNQRFAQLVDKVNTEGKGILQINVVGGPEAIPPFEIGSAVRSGIVDLANTTGVFHANMVPETLAMTLTNKSMDELRSNGGYDLMDKLHRDKANMVWLARLSDGIQYHVYTNKKVDSTDFSGLKLRSVPVYRPFFQALDATPLQVAPGEVFTALERGVVDGYGWPATGIFDLGWQEKTAYRVEPGFYNVEISLFMNQDSWAKLDEDQRTFLNRQIAWVESLNAQAVKDVEGEKLKQAEAGIQAIELTPEDGARFQQVSWQAGWQALEQISPDQVSALKAYFGS